MTDPLIIGIGNDFAGDDAAGREVVRALAGSGLATAESHGSAADLVTLMEHATHVILVDACRSGAAPGTIHRLNGAAPLPGWLRSLSSHGIGLPEAIALARNLGTLPRSLEIIAIEGETFTTGAPMTPAVQRAVIQTARLLLAKNIQDPTAAAIAP